MEIDNQDLKSTDFESLKTKLENAVVESIQSDNGALTYIIKDGLDLKVYAQLAKKVLETEGYVAHDFVGRVVNESKTDHCDFEYKSGWPLDGIAEGELE